MVNFRRIIFTSLASLVIVAALWAMPPAPDNQSTAIAEQTPAAQLSVSGKITAVAKDSFTLAVAGQTQHFAQDAPRPKAMTFGIDKNTAIEGKLQVNANAEVTYREDSGRNIAISVHVTP
ncbi:MAG TPA: hypothetical protein VIW93_03740 [Candidatus Acidoferrum sp.]